jgi:hypothetical protein
MLQRILPLARATQYEWLIAITETSLAETAATRGDWKAVRERSAAARKLGLAGIWTLSNRLDVLEAVTAMVEGDNPRALRIPHQRACAGHPQQRRDLAAGSPEPAAPGHGHRECNERCQAHSSPAAACAAATLDWLVVPAKVDTKALLQRNIS